MWNLSVRKHELYRASGSITGYLLNKDGVSETLHHVTNVSAILDFSPFIEKEAQRRMLDPFKETKYCVMSPAISQQQSGYLVAFRLQKCMFKMKRNFSFDNDYVFVQPYDHDFNPSGR